MDSLPQVLVVYAKGIGNRAVDELNDRLSFSCDVWYCTGTGYKSSYGEQVSSPNRFRPHHKSYSLVVYLGVGGNKVTHNLFVDEMTVNDPSETVDSIVEQIQARVNKFDRLKGTGTGYGSVVVFDLDRTIINDDAELLHRAVRPLVSAITNRFTYRVLWSHGDDIHVRSALEKISMAHLWDVIMVRPFDATETANKSLGVVLKALNSKLGVWGVSWSVLFDDLKENSVGDYDEHLVVPVGESARFYSQWYQKALDWVDDQSCILEQRGICFEH